MSHPRFAASERNIDVWLAFYNEIVDEQLLSRLRELLSDAERLQQQRFYFADDRKRYLVTRALVRTVLSQYVAVAPADWVFSANQYGRPEIANPNGEGGGLSFNLSHSRGLIALGVTQRRELGVDCENVLVRQVSIGIADRFFAPTEVAELAGVQEDQRQDRFFEYWTFKESYIKARGMGLSIPLDQFSFEYPHERGVRITIQPELADDAGRWCFWQFRPTPEHLLAICAERLEGAPPTLTIRKVVPTVMEAALDPPFTRTSEN